MTPSLLNLEVRHDSQGHVNRNVYLPFCTVPPGGVTAQLSPSGPVVLGTTVDLVCQATTGCQPISYSWTDASGVAVFPDDTDGNITVLLSTSRDYGTYTCIATNDFGMDTATVDVVQAGTVFTRLEAGGGGFYLLKLIYRPGF